MFISSNHASRCNCSSANVLRIANFPNIISGDVLRKSLMVAE
jgi:hypothetical protein